MLQSGLSPAPASGDDLVDVAIVGSGPGGLSAGLTCLRNDLSCVILEKEHLIASTVSRYPKGKSFMSEPSDARNLSYLPVFDGSKEELLAAWTSLIDDVKLPIRKGEAVEKVEKGADGIFTVRTTVRSYRARRVVLATGLRGKPRLLAVPGANLPKVHSVLEDADAYAGQRVLVVGGGDSAVEAAMSLCDAGASVTLSYRSKAFKRAKPANQKRIADYAAAGKIEVLMESNAVNFTDKAVTIEIAGGEQRTIANQQAFILIGAEAPVGWLEKLGVRFVERPHSYELGASDELVLGLVPDADDCPQDAVGAAARLRGQVVQVAPQPRPKPRRHRSIVDRIQDEWSKVRTAVHHFADAFTPAPTVVGSRGRAGTSLSGEMRSQEEPEQTQTREIEAAPPPAPTRPAPIATASRPSVPPPAPRARRSAPPPPPPAPRARRSAPPPPPPAPRARRSAPPPIPGTSQQVPAAAAQRPPGRRFRTVGDDDEPTRIALGTQGTESVVDKSATASPLRRRHGQSAVLPPPPAVEVEDEFGQEERTLVDPSPFRGLAL
jgi:putative YpdA family bacillithiol system oxidoreductase